jgi:hypothetical protein
MFHGPLRTNGAARQFKQAIGSVRRVVIGITPGYGCQPLGNRLLKAVGAALNVPADTLLECSHIDAEAVFHVALQHPLIRLIDLLHRNHFHVCNYVV